MIFEDRREAGRALGQALWEAGEGKDQIVLAVPRGGVPVGFEVARRLDLPLDVFVVRKLGYPPEPELAMGAVASGGLMYINQAVVRAFRIGGEQIELAAARERQEIERRERVYRGGHAPLSVEGRSVLIVDDGLATGSTMMAAVRTLCAHARRIVAAVPVAPCRSAEELRGEVDSVVCLLTPEPFHAVGEFYRNFDPTTDEEVALLLGQARDRENASSP